MTLQIEVVDPPGKIMDNINGDVTVERLWDDGAPANVSNVPLKNGFATYTVVPDKAHTNSTLNLVVSVNNLRYFKKTLSNIDYPLYQCHIHYTGKVQRSVRTRGEYTEE